MLSNTTVAEAVPADPPDPKALAHVIARLRTRFPTASAALIDHCVDDAARHFRDASVRRYLPILIERWASDGLREALRAPDVTLYAEVSQQAQSTVTSVPAV